VVDAAAASSGSAVMKTGPGLGRPGPSPRDTSLDLNFETRIARQVPPTPMATRPLQRIVGSGLTRANRPPTIPAMAHFR
jgi:hypothetical protein